MTMIIGQGWPVEDRRCAAKRSFIGTPQASAPVDALAAAGARSEERGLESRVARDSANDPVLSIGACFLLGYRTLDYGVEALRPRGTADADPATGYRRYREDQIAEAHIYARLRRLQMPVEAMRAVPSAGVHAVLCEHRTRLPAQADAVAELIGTVDLYLEKGMPVKATRISQVTSVADDLASSIASYRDAFDAESHQEISSFQFGAYPDDDFFLLTVANSRRHPWPGGPAKFGLLVDDVDLAHQRALGAGATEVDPPSDKPWKPRSSTVRDPSGNHIDLYAS